MVEGADKLWPKGAVPCFSFVNKVLLEHQPYSFIYILSTSAFCAQQQGGVDAGEGTWLAKPETFTTWPWAPRATNSC